MSVLSNVWPNRVTPFSKRAGISMPACPRVISISALIVALRISANPRVKRARYAARRRRTSTPMRNPNTPPMRVPRRIPSQTGIRAGCTVSPQTSIAWRRQSWVRVVDVTPIGLTTTSHVSPNRYSVQSSVGTGESQK